MKKGILWTFVAMAFACGETISTGPTGGGVHETPPPPEAPPGPGDAFPRVDSPFGFGGAIGFTLFAGARATEPQIRSLFMRVQSRLGPCAFARVCAEVQSWPSVPVWLPKGVSAAPFNDKAPAYIQLKKFLDVTSTISCAQVLVVPICTLKEDGTKPSNREKWVRAVAKLANEYEHTALEVVNEWRHPTSSITEGEMADLLGAARAVFNGWIGTDDSARPGDLIYNPRLRGLVDDPSFHPWRNPNPKHADIQQLINKNGGFAVLSETTAYNGGFSLLGPAGLKSTYSSGFTKLGGGGLFLGGCCTEYRHEIIDYMRACQAVEGCVFVYHCVGCLGFPETPIQWFPSGS